MSFRAANPQNADGGWGFHRGDQSRVEPTCWAARALLDSNKPQEPGNFGKVWYFLQSSQLSNGSWPASGGMTTGSWITSLACFVLQNDPKSTTHVKAGLKWLCEDFPRDSSLLRRFLQSLRAKSQIVSQNDSHRGWGWTPRTASWVEPTAFALMTLRDVAPQQLPANASQRRELAIALLYDRMCPGGGWNCGNPRVYGVDGDALVLPTCWALLCLREASEKTGPSTESRLAAKRIRKDRKCRFAGRGANDPRELRYRTAASKTRLARLDRAGACRAGNCMCWRGCVWR